MLILNWLSITTTTAAKNKKKKQMQNVFFPIVYLPFPVHYLFYFKKASASVTNCDLTYLSDDLLDSNFVSDFFFLCWFVYIFCVFSNKKKLDFNFTGTLFFTHSVHLLDSKKFQHSEWKPSELPPLSKFFSVCSIFQSMCSLVLKLATIKCFHRQISSIQCSI